jgi:hypothetical protein
VLPTSVYLESAHFKDGKLADPHARTSLADMVHSVLTLADSVHEPLGPPPLAAGRS